MDSASAQIDDSGQLVSVVILDRRWKWKYGFINGAYNTRLANDTVNPKNEKKPQEMARLLLKAMKESGFDVSDMPNDIRPQVMWEYSNPAEELQSLADVCGCRVVLGTDNKVRIAKKGERYNIPETGKIDHSPSLNPADIPDKVRIVFAPTRYQATWTTEAVGVDTDGKIKKINDLSYKPAAGWGEETIYGFWNVDEDERELAKKTVFRWYRMIKTVDTIKINHYGDIDYLYRELVEFESASIEVQEVDAAKGEYQNIPARVVGEWFDFETFVDSTLITEGFTVDPKRGIIKFGKPIVKQQVNSAGDGIGYVEATVTPRLGCSMKPDMESPLMRHYEEFSLGGEGGLRSVLDEEHELQVLRQSYLHGDNERDNKDELKIEAVRLMKVLEDDYQTDESFGVRYEGILNITPSGSVLQVGWSFGSQPAVTVVSVNSEFDKVIGSEDHKNKLAKDKAYTAKVTLFINKQQNKKKKIE